MYSQKPILGNFTLFWLEEKFEKSNEKYQNDLKQLQSTVNDVNIFTDRDECLDFLTGIDDIKVFFIVNHVIDEQMISIIHDIPQLDVLYIFDDDNSTLEDNQWIDKWPKIDGIHKEMKTICDALRMAIKLCNQDSINFSFLTMDDMLDENMKNLEPTFLFTKRIKEIIVDMEPTEHSFHEILEYWREYYATNPSILNVINEFERDYSPKTAIKWYTCENFVFEMLNEALRLMETEVIMKMSFLIRDLHQQLIELQEKQLSTCFQKPFTVYRGQGLSRNNFDKLQRTQNGLMSFNSFLSTSDDKYVSKVYAESASGKEDLIGILFEIFVDPLISSTSYARIKEFSNYPQEEETLFSMHTVFRIGEITKIDNSDKLYQVKLTLLSDNDEQLFDFNGRLREVGGYGTGWRGLAPLLILLNQMDRAERLYKFLLEQTNDEQDQIEYLYYLAYIKNDQGDYETAIDNLYQMVEIMEKTDMLDYFFLVIIYNSITAVYTNTGDYFKAIEYGEKTLESIKRVDPSRRYFLMDCCLNIGDLNVHIGDYDKALLYYKEAIHMNENNLNASLFVSFRLYDKIGEIYDHIGKYKEALSYKQRGLAIGDQILPPDHPTLIMLYCSIGSIYRKTGQYELALSFQQKILDLLEQTSTSSLIDMTLFYYSIGETHLELEDYSRALLFFQKGLDVLKTKPLPNPSRLAVGYNNIGTVFSAWGKYSEAVDYYQQAVELYQKTVPKENIFLATCYMNIGTAYYYMTKYSEADHFILKAVEIYERDLPSDHPNLATSYDNLGMVYNSLENYPKALHYLERSIGILQQNLRLNHQAIAHAYNNIGSVYYNMGDHSKAFSSFLKASETMKTVLPSNSRVLGTAYFNMAKVCKKTGEHAKARSYYERAVGIFNYSLPSHHPLWQTIKAHLENLNE